MKIIDLETYPRRTHYEFFKSLAYPYIGLTVNVDVTNLVHYAKAHHGSTFLACMWAIAQAANSVPELRQRIVNDQIVEYDHCNTAHTVALPDHTFTNCRTDCRMSLDEYLVQGKKWQDEAKTRHGFLPTQEDPTDLIFASCVPWVTFTQAIQPVSIPADSNPRVVMGKYIYQDDRILLPVQLQCHHALVDGYHLSQFFLKVEEISNSIG